jgi:hypothetical protein
MIGMDSGFNTNFYLKTDRGRISIKYHPNDCEAIKTSKVYPERRFIYRPEGQSLEAAEGPVFPKIYLIVMTALYHDVLKNVKN